MTSSLSSAFTPTARRIATILVEARRTGTPLPAFPGTLPTDLAGAYDCQEAAIALWKEVIIGWKVGGIPADAWDRLGATRVAGPIFKAALRNAEEGQVVPFPVFHGGFAAVEAEFTVQLSHDAPPDRLDWTTDEALEMIGAIHISVETAGSPLANINVLGPTAVASDFGNNAGLILGPPIVEWQKRAFESTPCETMIDGICVGRGNALSLVRGPVESLRFLLENCARRDRPLTAGTLVATGAVTGIHDIRAGQIARIEFGPYGTIGCRAQAFAGGSS